MIGFFDLLLAGMRLPYVRKPGVNRWADRPTEPVARPKLRQVLPFKHDVAYNVARQKRRAA